MKCIASPPISPERNFKAGRTSSLQLEYSINQAFEFPTKLHCCHSATLSSNFNNILNVISISNDFKDFNLKTRPLKGGGSM